MRWFLFFKNKNFSSLKRKNLIFVQSITFLFLVFSPSRAPATSWEAQTEEEALFIRRIADFWQEGEYQIVKAQIEEFLKEYPDSSLSQTLCATLGDLYVREKNYKGALSQYAKINDAQLLNRIFINRMQCLLDLQWFATLSDECENFLKLENLEENQKLQATYFLAISLYQQCLNTPNNAEMLTHLATRAQPYFQTLAKGEISTDVAEAFAHLSCILKDYVSASQIYLKLAEQNGQNREEMLFQAALLQSEFDRELAMKTFNEICMMNQKRAPEALYHRLHLHYDFGQYEEVLRKKDELLTQIPADQREVAHLFFGRCHLKLQQYAEALKELHLFTQTASTSPSLKTALIDILEASYHLDDEKSLKTALSRLSELFPDDQQISKGILAHALLLKKSDRVEEAFQELEQLRARYQESKDAEAALFEELHIEFQKKQFDECLAHCRLFLKNYVNPDLAPHVWRYLGSSALELFAQTSNASLKEELILDIESMISNDQTLSAEEILDWNFLLAKTYYEVAKYPSAIALLENLTKNEHAQKANFILLLSLCYRDHNKDFEAFCKNAETALSMGADLMNPASLHIALYNGYLSCKNDSKELALEHLFAASELIDLQPEHQLFLSDFFYDKSIQKEPGSEKTEHIQKAIRSYEKLISTSKVDIHALSESTIAFEGVIVKLAELFGLQNDFSRKIELIQSLKSVQEAHPAWAWKEENQVDLLLATHYREQNQNSLAMPLYDRILAKNPMVRSFASASALLEKTRLNITQLNEADLTLENPEIVKILSQLKTLLIQKTLINEPVHLEAALEYVDLQVRLEDPSKKTEKRLSLLQKMKLDFESSNDLLSSDYQNSRKHLLQKNRIYQSYMNFFDAQILYCKTELASNSAQEPQLYEQVKKSFQDVVNEKTTPFLAQKAQEKLKELEISHENEVADQDKTEIHHPAAEEKKD